MLFLAQINIPSRVVSAFLLAGTASAIKNGGAATTHRGLSASMRGDVQGGLARSTAMVELMSEVFDNMFLEFCVLFFVILGFGLLRVDKLSKRKPQSSLPAIVPKLKAVRLEFQNHPAIALKLWREIMIGGHKECCTLDVLRMVMQCALDDENWASNVKDIARYVAGFPDPLKAMPHASDESTNKKIRSGDKTAEQGKTVVLNQLLRVAAKATRPLDNVISTLREHFDASPNEETYEILLSGYAHAGDEQRVEETKEGMRAQFRAVSPKAYTAVVMGFLKSKKVESARSAIAELLQVGCHLPTYAVVELAKTLAVQDGAGASLDEIMRITKDHEDPPVDAFSVVLDEAFKRGEHTLAEKVDAVKQTRRIELSYHGYESMVKHFAALGNPLAVQYFDQMAAKFTLSEGTCVTLICCCAESRFLKLAEHIVDFRREKGMSLQVYSALMKVYAASKLYDKCCDLYPSLIADGVQPDDVMLGCLMNFAARAGRTDFAEQLFAQGGPQSKVVQNYMSQIRNCRHRGGVDRALELLSQLRSQGLEDQTACNSVLDVCVSAGETDKAKKLFEQFKGQYGFDIIACNTMIKGYCNFGRIDDAIALLRSAKSEGHPLSDVSYNCILNAHVRARSYSAAWSWYEEMVSHGISEDVFTVSTLVKAVKTSTDKEFTTNVLHLLDRTDVDITSDEVVLTVVLDALVRLKDMRRLQHLVRKVKEMKTFPPVSTINTIIKALSSLKRIDEVMELWHVMTEVRAMEPNDISIGCVVDACVSNNRVGEALELVSQWKSRIQMNTVIYSTLIKGFAITREAHRAIEVFNLMQAEGVEPNLVTLNTLIDACARAGSLEKAAAILETATARGLEPDRITFSTLVKGFCIAGQVEQAITVMESSRRRGLAPDVFMFNTIMDHCTNVGRLDIVDRLYAQLLAEGLAPTNFTLGVLLKRYGKDGQLDKAFECVERIPEKYRFSPNTQEMTCLISACIINKQIHRALKVYKTMYIQGPPPDAVTYERLISGILRFGTVEKAVELLQDAAGLRGPLGRAEGAQVFPSGTVTPGGSIARVAHLDAKVVEAVVDALRAQGKTEAVAIPLLQELRAAGVHVPQRLLAGAVKQASTGFKTAPWKRREA